MTAPAIAILARSPQPGRVKTRLAHAIGDAQALAVYRELLRVTAAATRHWPAAVVVHSSGDDAAWSGQPLGDVPRRTQVDGGLGARLRAALADAFAAGAQRAIAIGSDCPGLTRSQLEGLDAALDGHQVAFGPAEDGGYWGVAVATPVALAVIGDERLPWSTPDLLAASTAACDRAGLTWRAGPQLADLDEVRDLQRARAAGFAV